MKISMHRRILILEALVIILVSLLIGLSVFTSFLYQRDNLCQHDLSSVTESYKEEQKKDKSWDCNPEIRQLVDDLQKAEHEKDKCKHKYLLRWVDEIQEIR